MRHARTGIATAAVVVTAGFTVPLAHVAGEHQGGTPTATPIQHLVVIFQENVSFDHYFGTYPKALNPGSEPAFTARPGTPSINGLTPALLGHNPNLGNPHRLDRSEALTCDQNHEYTAEQSAVDSGLQDAYVQNTSNTNGGSAQTRAQCDIPPQATATPNDFAVMDYYDGNTVTALWNYAQHFAMSDNSFSSTFGPSTPGALNVVSGNTYPALCAQRPGVAAPGGNDPDVYNGNGDVGPCPGGIATSSSAPAGNGTGTVVADPDQYYDVCSNPKNTAALGGRNVGDQLTSKGVTWGWFNGGFQNAGYQPGHPETSTVASSKCTAAHYNIGAGASNDGQPCVKSSAPPALAPFCQADYSAHHQPFQYYSSTSNPQHLAPTSVAKIGQFDQANHQYDLADFFAAADAGNLPSVSYLKAPRFQDGHPGNSDPLDEQTFLVSTINHLQHLDSWSSTAVVIAYDDSDGWYDHAMPPITVQSQTPLDTLRAGKDCGGSAAQVPMSDSGKPEQGRCGYGPRQPLLVVSPFARENYVDHSITDQASIVRFVEDNWGLGRIGNGSVDYLAGSLDGMFNFSAPRDDNARTLILDPSTGQPAKGDGSGD